MAIGGFEGKVDFGIITIRDDEFEAVLKHFPEPIRTISGHRRYRLRRAPISATEAYTVGVLRCIEAGNGEAHDAARDLLEDLAPGWLLMVGIAGGVPAHEFTLGDVVVSNRIVDFSVEAVLKDDAHEYALGGGPLHRDAGKLAADLRAMVSDGELDGWNSPEAIGAPRPPVDIADEKFYGDAAWRRDVREKLERHVANGPARPPLVTTGVIASSDRLIKDAEILQVWLKMARQIQAIEMESAGVYKAAQGREVPFLAIRGISDVVGHKRHPDWTAYACRTAAAFARAFLRARPIPPREQNKQGSPAKIADPPAGAGSVHTFERVVGPEPLPRHLFDPGSGPRPPGGSYERDWYVHRSAMRNAQNHLRGEGKPVILWAPADSGKTWILSHLLETFRAEPETRVILVNLEGLGKTHGASFETLMEPISRQIFEAIGSRPAALRCAQPFPDWLDELMTGHVLPDATRVIVAFDWADAVCGTSAQDDFFGQLRNWAQRGARDHKWSALRLVVAVRRDPNKLSTTGSPFANLTSPIRLEDFKRHHILDLAHLYGLDWGDGEVADLVSEVDGHPYLVRQVMYDAAVYAKAPGELLADPATRYAYLSRYRERLGRDVKLFKELRAAHVAGPRGGALRRDPAAVAPLLEWGLLVEELGLDNPGPRYRLRCKLFEDLCV